MKMIKAKKGHSYAGTYRKKGTVYKAKDRDAKVLIAVRVAEPYVEPPPKPAPKRRGRPPGSTTTRTRRTYQRKDMQAEAE